MFSRTSVDGDEYVDYQYLWLVHPDGTGLVELPNAGEQAWEPAGHPTAPGSSTPTITTVVAEKGQATCSPSTLTAPMSAKSPTRGATRGGFLVADGARIVFVSEGEYRRYQGGIWTMSATGKHPELIARHGYTPSWNPTFARPQRTPPPHPDDTGPAIAYIAATAAGYDLFTVHPDGTHVRQRTHDGSVSHPVWSPDHDQIAYLRGSSVRVLDVRTGKDERVRNHSAATGLDWSPDGARLVWTTYHSLTFVNLGTHRRQRHTYGDRYYLTDPAWSPDGRFIAFSRGGGDMEIVPAAGGKSQVHLTAQKGWEFRPSWSPDGAWIAYTHQRGSWRMPTARLAMIHPDGSGAFELDRRGIEAGWVWSPRGTRLAAYSDGPRPTGPNPQPGLWTMGPRGGDRHLVVTGRTISDVDW